MVYRVAVNGFGRIGRCVVRSAVERGMLNSAVEIVAINDLWPPSILASPAEQRLDVRAVPPARPGGGRGARGR